MQGIGPIVKDKKIYKRSHVLLKADRSDTISQYSSGNNK